ncbi:MAG: hypothetical protein ABI432_01370 [Flavobacteriales bacterium]
MLGLIDEFNALKAKYDAGSTDLGAKELGEALWTSEADLNYQKGNALVVSYQTRTEDIVIDLPIFSEGGMAMVKNNDLIEAQESVLARIIDTPTNGTVYMIDVELRSATAEEARVGVHILRRFIAPSPMDPPQGHYPLYNEGQTDAVAIMNGYLTYTENLYWITDVHPAFFTSVSPEKHLYDNDWYANVYHVPCISAQIHLRVVRVGWPKVRQVNRSITLIIGTSMRS